ncbi:MAG TPA: hypothetical protein VMO17_21395 [Terriglobia bacterium]|nr:hypothetical protein [Terriglobia bacterium]
MQIQYVGFQLKAHGRDYTYRVIDNQAADREFIFSISNRSFTEKQLPFQEAAGLCYQKLQKALELETAEKPLPRRTTLSAQDLDVYRQSRRPARKRSW